MLKALLKKEFLQINKSYFTNTKTGKRRSKLGTIGFVALFILLMIYLGFMFYLLADSMCENLYAAGLDWLYFLMMALFAVCFGVFGSVFNTYANLYLSKDNDLLLSMPIPPSKILLSRLVTVFLLGMLYEGLLLIPAIIKYYQVASLSFIQVVSPILLFVILGFFIASLTCLLGWCIAILSVKLKNKSFVTVLLALLFFGAYYFFFFKINGLIADFITNAAVVGMTITDTFYPLYMLGQAFTGNVVDLLIYGVVNIAIFGACYYVLSNSFIKIATMKKVESKIVKKKETVKSSSLQRALFNKELKKFTSTSTYMLNCGLGIVFLPLVTGYAVFKSKDIYEMVVVLINSFNLDYAILGIGLIIVFGFTTSMNDISAPSVSLEGKAIWSIQSLPVDPKDVLKAKVNLNVVLSGIPTLICSIILGIVLHLDFEVIILVTVSNLLFVQFFANLGIMVNLLRPNLHWTNETAPIKQSLAVFIVLFGGWLFVAAYGYFYYLLYETVTPMMYMIIGIVILTLATRLIQRWLYTKGAQIFQYLS